MHLIKRRNIVVPLQKRCSWTAPFDSPFIESPNRVDDRVIVCVERVLLKLRVARDVNLCDPLGRNTVHVLQWVEAVIARRDIDIVHVQKNAAVCLLDNFVQKLPLRHLGEVELGIAAQLEEIERGFFDLMEQRPA